MPVLETGMDGFSSWVDGHFNLIQSIGIIATLLFTGIGLHREAKAKEVENFLTQTQHHRELWSLFIGNKDLERIFNADVDVTKNPPTAAETELLNLMFVNFQNGWRVAKAGGITTLREIREDVESTFPLPLPRAVWEKTKKFRNREFVRFVEKVIK